MNAVASSSSGAPPPLRSTTSATSAKVWRIVLAVCAIANIVPLFCARHLPMADLPEHLASMATVRHYGDPAWRGAEHFTVAGVLETPYWLYHAVGAGLAIPMGSAERANLVMLACVGLAYPYALRALLVALRRDPRLAIFGCALFWTNNLIIGVLNFVASVPLVLFALAVVINQAKAPTRRRGVALAALSIAIFYLHLSSFGLFILDAALLTFILAPKKNVLDALLRLPRTLAWFVPAGLLGAVVLRAGHMVANAGPNHAPNLVVWNPRINVLGNMRAWLFDCFRSQVDDVLGIGLVVVLGLLLVVTRPRKAQAQTQAQTTQAQTEDQDQRSLSHCTWVLAGSAFLVRVLSPSQVGSDALALDVRMAVFVALFAITLPRVLEGRRATILFASAAAMVLGLAVNTTHEVRAFEREEVAGFDALLREMPHGKRLLMLNFAPQSAHVNANVFGYFGSYYRARYGGVASFSFSETAHWPVRYRDDARPPHELSWGNPCVYRNRTDGQYFDYVLTRGDHAPFTSSMPGPRWELVGGSRAWRLFKKADAGAGASTDDDDGACPRPNEG